MSVPHIPFPQRKQIPHGVLYLDSQPTVIFDTVCTRNRRPWLDNHDVHVLLRQVWSQASLWLVGRYVIMPDHIHIFAAATADAIGFENWCRYWKSQFSKHHRNSLHRWQEDHWDTRIQGRQQYEEKWHYVRDNPVRAGLVGRAEDWPYQGILHPFVWD